MKKHRRKRACDVASHLKKRLIDQELTPRDFWICYAVYGVLAVLASCCAFSTLLARRAIGAWSMPPVVLVLLALVVLAAFCFLLWKERKDAARVFALIALPAGFGFALFLLPGHVPDEAWHIFRVFDIFHAPDKLVVPASFEIFITQTDGLTSTGYLRSYADMYELLALPASSETMDVTRMLEGNSNLLYLVPGLVVQVLNLFGANPFASIIVARSVNLALFIVAGFWMIRIIPLGKVMLCVYLLSPICLQQEASCSADAITNITTLLFVAYVVRLRFSERVTKKQLGLALLLLVLVLFSKPSYFLLAYLLILLVPKLPEAKRKPVYLGVCAVTLVGIVAAFLIPLSGTYGEMIGFIKEDPLNALAVIARSGYQMGEVWFWQFAGGSLGGLEITPWRIATLVYVFALFSTIFVSLEETVSFERFEKALLVVFVAVFLAVLLTAFRTWTLEVDGISDYIMGVQGRYVIPVLILVMLACLNAKSYLKRPHCLLVYTGCLAFVYAFGFFAMTRFF